MPKVKVKAKKLLASLLLFVVLLGFYEAVAVVYHRAHYDVVHARYYPERRANDWFPLLRLDQLEAAGPQPVRLLIVELIRSGLPIIMLAAVGAELPPMGGKLRRCVGHMGYLLLSLSQTSDRLAI